MKKILFVIILMVLPAIVFARGFDDETITVADTAVGFTTAKLNDKYTAICTLKTAQINFRFRSSPTSTIGHTLDIGQTVRFFTDEIMEVKFIRTGAVSGSLFCTYR